MPPQLFGTLGGVVGVAVGAIVGVAVGPLIVKDKRQLLVGEATGSSALGLLDGTLGATACCLN